MQGLEFEGLRVEGSRDFVFRVFGILCLEL